MAKIASRKRHGTYIVLGEQVEGAEELVVLEIKRPGGLEVATEGEEGGRLYNKLFWGPYLAELLVVLGSRDSGSPSRAPTMVVVVVMGVKVRRVMLRAVAEHGCDGRGGCGMGFEEPIVGEGW